MSKDLEQLHKVVERATVRLGAALRAYIKVYSEGVPCPPEDRQSSLIPSLLSEHQDFIDKDLLETVAEKGARPSTLQRNKEKPDE